MPNYYMYLYSQCIYWTSQTNGFTVLGCRKTHYLGVELQNFPGGAYPRIPLAERAPVARSHGGQRVTHFHSEKLAGLTQNWIDGD